MKQFATDEQVKWLLENPTSACSPQCGYNLALEVDMWRDLLIKWTPKMPLEMGKDFNEKFRKTLELDK